MATNKTSKKSLSFEKIYPYLLVFGGFFGLLMSFIITIEKIHILADPSFVPECSINPVISCGNIMKSEQASVVGFPNPLVGLMAYPVVVTFGMAMLAGAKFKRWFWLGLNIGSALGAIFCMWLFHEAVYEIGSLCLYCIGAWAVTIPIFLYTTVWNIRNGHIKLKGWCARVGDFIQKHHGDILVTWYLLIFLGIVTHFWYYWKTIL